TSSQLTMRLGKNGLPRQLLTLGFQTRSHSSVLPPMLRATASMQRTVTPATTATLTTGRPVVTCSTPSTTSWASASAASTSLIGTLSLPMSPQAIMIGHLAQSSITRSSKASTPRSLSITSMATATLTVASTASHASRAASKLSYQQAPAVYSAGA